VRVATWNVNGLRARLELVLHWLQERQPDVVGLQELKLQDDQFPREAIEAAGYHALVLGQKAWNGVAILSREPAELVQRGLPGQEDFGSRLISAEVGGILCTTVYVPNGKDLDHADFPRKLAWLETLAMHLAEQRASERPSLVCGDFNVCPTALDTWSEEKHRGRIFHTDEERERIGSLLDAGFVDLFRERHPDEQVFSWWDYRGGSFPRNHGLRIDFLLGSASLAERLGEVSIDRDWRKKRDGLTPSDHVPVVADLA